MLPIFSFLGLAIAAALWPEPQTAADTDSTVDDGPEQTRSETLGQTPDQTLLSFATSETANNHETLAAAEIADDEDYQDELIGGDDDDVLSGTDGSDLMFGYAGNDVLSGGSGPDVLDGGEGDDQIYGTDDTAPDTLIGGDGHDQIWVGDGDTATGGSGDDVFRMDENGVAHISDYSPDDDRVEVIYDPRGPVPELSTTTTDEGISLFAGSDLVAVFGGAKVFDVSWVALVPEAA